MTAYRAELLEKLAKLDETTITPSQPCPNTEKQYIRVVHDETTFYSNADQMTFWNDGECQVLRQKSLGSSIMVSDFIVRDDKGEARLYLETPVVDAELVKGGFQIGGTQSALENFANDHTHFRLETTFTIGKFPSAFSTRLKILQGFDDNRESS